jgi:hypothetical protein
MIPCILLKSLTIRLNLLLTYLIILIYEKCHIYLAQLVGHCIIYIGGRIRISVIPFIHLKS